MEKTERADATLVPAPDMDTAEFLEDCEICPFCGNTQTHTKAVIAGQVWERFGCSVRECFGYSFTWWAPEDIEWGRELWNMRTVQEAERLVVGDETKHCVCGDCGTGVDPWDEFCRKCGRRLVDKCCEA